MPAVCPRLEEPKRRGSSGAVLRLWVGSPCRSSTSGSESHDTDAGSTVNKADEVVGVSHLSDSSLYAKLGQHLQRDALLHSVYDSHHHNADITVGRGYRRKIRDPASVTAHHLRLMSTSRTFVWTDRTVCMFVASSHVARSYWDCGLRLRGRAGTPDRAHRTSASQTALSCR